MKALLEFNLPEDTVDHQLALDGWKYRNAIEKIDNELRNLEKYQNFVDIPIARVRKLIGDTLDELGVTLFD